MFGVWLNFLSRLPAFPINLVFIIFAFAVVGYFIPSNSNDLADGDTSQQDTEAELLRVL